MTNEELADFLIDNEITLAQVVDVTIDTNSIIGVGLVSLGDSLREHILFNKILRTTPPTDVSQLKAKQNESDISQDSKQPKLTYSGNAGGDNPS
jgi:hypothetical protein